MHIDLDNRRWVIEFQLPAMRVTCVLGQEMTEDDALKEIEKYQSEHGDSVLVEYFHGAYDHKKDAYVKINMNYVTDCGKTILINSKAKTRKVFIQRVLLSGECKDKHILFYMHSECKECKTKKNKTRRDFVNNDDWTVYQVEETSCMARKIK